MTPPAHATAAPTDSSQGELTLGVALCTYNGAAYVGAQIESILKQTRPVHEIVVSDDGSRDDTLERVQRQLAGHPVRCTLLGDGRRGITQNFARAVAACSADVIFLCDQDDVWLPQKVERLAAVFEADPKALLVFSDARLVDQDLNDLGRSQFDMVRMRPALQRALEGPRAFETLLRRNVVTGATVAFRRTLLTRALPFIDGWLHDEWLAILAAAYDGLRCVPEPLVLYRQHGSNQCGMRPEPVVRQVSAAARTQKPGMGTKRLQAVLDRLQSHPSERAQAQLEWLRAAESFQAVRSALPPGRWQRVAQIAAWLLGGRYNRFGDGVRSAAKDFLATAR